MNATLTARFIDRVTQSSQNVATLDTVRIPVPHPAERPRLQSETDRYIAWPAQALSYKLGQLKFRELRERAQKELGPKFDIRTFHDEMLNGGTLPLDLLEARTDRWIAEEKAK